MNHGMAAWGDTLRHQSTTWAGPATAVYGAWGVRFGLAAPDATLLAALRAQCPLGWSPAPPGPVDVGYTLSHDPQRHAQPYTLRVGTTPMARATTLASIVLSFSRHAEFTMALLARDALFVHAGVVAIAGQALLLPGRSFSGKTTLVAALLAAGATYHSDEFAILDRTGQVHPYARPLAIRRDGQMHPTPADALGGMTGQVPVPVGLIVVTRYQLGARWRPRLLTPGQALLVLMDNTVAAQGDPAHSMPILRQTVDQATALHSLRGDAPGPAAFLLRRLSGSVIQEDTPNDPSQTDRHGSCRAGR